MRKNLLGCLGIVGLITLVISLMGNVLLSGLLFGGRADVALPPVRFQQVVEQAAASGAQDGPRIAHIDLEGVISNDGGADSIVSETKRALDQALGDARVKAIVLRVDSPGGEVTASDTIYHAVKLADAQKPVIIYMDSMAASGGYYVACGARKVVANPNTWTGSIGVIVQSMGYGELMEKVGVKMRIFRSGDFKDAMYGHREMTPAEQEYMQGMVMQTYDRFVGIVAEARGIPEADLRSGVADGRVVSGQDAVGLKLVDRTGYQEDAWQEAREAAGLTDAEVVRYTRPAPLISLPPLLGQAMGSAPVIPARVEIDVSERILPRLLPGRCYLLPEFMTR